MNDELLSDVADAASWEDEYDDEDYADRMGDFEWSDGQDED